MATWSDVTVIVITLNEGSNIGGCLASVRRAGEVIVVDCGSSDSTAEVVSSMGRRLVYHPFETYSQQYNFGLGLADTNYVMWLDADERISPELEIELGQLLASDPSVVDMPRINYFMGDWVRHSGWFPEYQSRLWRAGEVEFESRQVHARPLVGHMPRVKASQLIYHFSYKNVSHWLDKINRYTSLEVNNKQQGIDDIYDEWVNYDFRQRFKFRIRNMPLRPLSRFVWMFVIKRGFLDGYRGLALALLSAFYEVVAQVKLQESLRGLGEQKYALDKRTMDELVEGVPNGVPFERTL